jgi:hypothetical protein
MAEARDVIKLTGRDNYQQWRVSFLAFLMTRGLWERIRTGYATNEERDQATGWLFLTISPDLAVEILNRSDPDGHNNIVWWLSTLENRFGEEDSSEEELLTVG